MTSKTYLSPSLPQMQCKTKNVTAYIELLFILFSDMRLVIGCMCRINYAGKFRPKRTRTCKRKSQLRNARGTEYIEEDSYIKDRELITPFPQLFAAKSGAYKMSTTEQRPSTSAYRDSPSLPNKPSKQRVG